MHRTQISLDEPLYEAVRRRAFERRVSMSQMVREALTRYLVAGDAQTDASPTSRDAGGPARAAHEDP